jgi:hypothetical protein
MGSRRSALVGLDVDAQRADADADADGDGFAPRIAGGSRSRTNKNAPRTTASETATRMNAERVLLDPRIEGGAIEGGAIADSGGGVLFGMPTRYNKGAAASTPAPGGKGAKGRLRCRVADEEAISIEARKGRTF